MSNFIKLRLILQEAKPDLNNFLVELQKEDIQKGDLDLLLRKAVESKLVQFSQFCIALVRKGASINFYDSKDHVSNLMLACEKGTTNMVQALLRYKDLNLVHADVRQLHAGFYSIENKSKEDSEGILKLLLQREPALVNREAGNQTLLIAAIRKGKIELVKLLLEAGADPNWQVPDTGNTSLHDAVKQLKSKLSKAMSQIIRLLLLKGGDSLRKNKQQKTVYDYAEKALPDYQKIQEYIREHQELQQQKIAVLYELNDESQFQSVHQSAQHLFEQYEEQSEEEEPFLAESDIHINLAEEIQAFEKECLSDYEAVQRDLKAFVRKLEKIVQPQGLLVEIYGSFATGLWVRQSNIDLQLTRKDVYDNSLSPKEIIEKVYDSLKRHSICRSVSMFSRSPRVSVIRVQLGEGPKVKNIHITVSDRNQSGMAVVNFIKEQMELYRQLRPIFFVLKALSCHFKLNQPKNGGIRTYALVIMLLSCISKWNRCDIGKLLIDFLFYFGFYYDYLYERRGQEGNPLEDEGITLQIIDPLNPSNDLGKNVRASDLQKMFRSTYIALHTNVGNSGRLKIMFETNKILLL